MAEVCAERGYARASVAEVARRAGVSSLTFYKQFGGKQDCLLATHRQLLGRLLEEVDSACREESAVEARARAVVRTALTLFAADPPSARLLTVEVLAAGAEGSKRHDAMVSAFAERLSAGWVPVAGMLALIGRLAVAGEAARLPELEDELVATVLPQS